MSKLLEARDILLERGFTQSGEMMDENGCVCALGALNLAYGQDLSDDDKGYFPFDPEHLADIRRLADVITSRTGRWDVCRAFTIYKYNDSSSTTQADIVSFFEEAAL